jgi:hypothetical protein
MMDLRQDTTRGLRRAVRLVWQALWISNRDSLNPPLLPMDPRNKVMLGACPEAPRIVHRNPFSPAEGLPLSSQQTRQAPGRPPTPVRRWPDRPTETPPRLQSSRSLRRRIAHDSKRAVRNQRRNQGTKGATLHHRFLGSCPAPILSAWTSGHPKAQNQDASGPEPPRSAEPRKRASRACACVGRLTGRTLHPCPHCAS